MAADKLVTNPDLAVFTDEEIKKGMTTAEAQRKLRERGGSVEDVHTGKTIKPSNTGGAYNGGKGGPRGYRHYKQQRDAEKKAAIERGQRLSKDM